MDYQEFLSDQARRSEPSPIRIYAEMARESPVPLVNLAPGFTADERAYLVGAKFELRDGSFLELDKGDLRVAQQYNNSDGILPLREFLTDLTVRLHNPPTYQDSNQEKALRVIVDGGNLQGLSIASTALLNQGDTCLVPEYYYGGYVGLLTRLDVQRLSYKVEDDGPNIEHLEEMLSQWDPADENNWSKRPKCLTIVPNGGNPTGETTSLEKRRKIYALARKYNFIIIEDDSYCFVQFKEQSLPSFLSMDVDGRVVRLDSFSKVIGPGFRVGWLSGPHTLVTKMLFELQYTIQHSSIFAQVVLNKLIRQWGIEGFLKNANEQRDYYRKRRDQILRFAETHLKDLAKWKVPQGGMFLWLKANDVDDSSKFVTDYAIKNGFIVVPGHIFTHEQRGPCPYFRIAFGTCPENEVEKGIIAFAKALKEAAASRNV